MWGVYVPTCDKIFSLAVHTQHLVDFSWGIILTPSVQSVMPVGEKPQNRTRVI